VVIWLVTACCLVVDIGLDSAVSEEGSVAGFFKTGNKPSGFIEGRGKFTVGTTISFLRKTLFREVS
jgi:hypothetical protein